jgi:hypothetical protein
MAYRMGAIRHLLPGGSYARPADRRYARETQSDHLFMHVSQVRCVRAERFFPVSGAVVAAVRGTPYPPPLRRSLLNILITAAAHSHKSPPAAVERVMLKILAAGRSGSWKSLNA